MQRPVWPIPMLWSCRPACDPLGTPATRLREADTHHRPHPLVRCAAPAPVGGHVRPGQAAPMDAPPPGWTTTTCECDPRVGGALEVAWKSEEADPAMTLRGVFTEVVLHERIVHTETMALGQGRPLAPWWRSTSSPKRTASPRCASHRRTPPRSPVTARSPPQGGWRPVTGSWRRCWLGPSSPGRGPRLDRTGSTSRQAASLLVHSRS